MATGRHITRRAFLQAAAAAAGAAALPISSSVVGVLRGVEPASSTSPVGAPANVLGGPFFLTGSNAALYDTAAALCARILPSQPEIPGAAEANAVQFIDMFLAAFELPAALADNPGIYIRGRFSGRNPYPPTDSDGSDGDEGPTGWPADELEGPSGKRHFLGMTPPQAMAWYLRLYGSLTGLPAVYQSFAPSPAWLGQVTAAKPAIPGVVPGGLRGAYVNGLNAFDSWSHQNFGRSFAAADPLEQEVLVLIAGNLLVNALSGQGLPALPAPLPSPLPPAAATALFPSITLHTIQGTYCLPEYGGNGGSLSPTSAPVTWASLGWDGDTMPVGNSIYDDDTYGPGQGPNAGFGDPLVFQPRGSYREYRPVSTVAGDAGTVTAAQLTELVAFLSTFAHVEVL